VAVSPGVPNRSERGREGLSLSLFRSGRGASGGGGGAGAGARSPGRIPAFSAAAVGRKTLTWRDGMAGADLVSGISTGACASAATISGAGATSIDIGDSSAIVSGAASAGFSARTAGVNFLTSLAGVIGFGAAGSAA